MTTEDLGEITGFYGIEISASNDCTINIGHVSIHDDIVAVCKGDSKGNLSVKYLRKKLHA